MSDNIKLDKMTFSQKTAIVYGGAAVLILVVGLRSILLTTEEMSTLSYFTIGAIILETILLFVYAQAIYNQSDDDDQGESLSFNLDMSTLENKISELNTGIEKLNTSIGTMDNIDSELKIDTVEFENISNNLSNSIDNLESKISGLKENADYLSEKLSNVLEGIVVNNDKIDKVLNRQINEEIKSEIRKLLEQTLAK